MSLEKQKRADDIIKNHVMYSMGAGLIPLPILDIVAVTAIQVDMINQLANLFEQDYSESRAKAWIGTLSGSILARLGADAIKLIPGIGTIIGGISMAALSGASTYAIGQVVTRHYSTGGTSATFSAEAHKAEYEKEFSIGKNKAETWHKEGSKAEQKTTDPLAKLREIAELKNAGIITEEEFLTLKKKLIDSI